MYCACSNKNNYEVIALCDIKKFSEKNGPFNDKSWVQISIADVLMLDCNKVSIEKIEKIYVNVDITSTKIIETPVSPSPNSEGMTLTGKKLLIDGYICSKIIYTSLTKEQSVYTSNFTVPFCTYIVIEANADPFNDRYCIKSCIEDVFLSLIDCKTIFQNVTLFLLAEKTSLTCPTSQPPAKNCIIIPSIFLQSHIILNNQNNSPVIDISFDIANKEIIVVSTGNTTASTGTANYFKFILYNFDGTTEKLSATIAGNEDGMDFLNRILKQKFQDGDVVKIQAEAPDKVIITNFPDSTTARYTLQKNEETFKITSTGLFSITLPITLLPNQIVITNTNNKEVARIRFDVTNKKLIATSTGEQISNPDNRAMVLFYVREDLNVRYYSFIPSNQSTSQFVTDLNNKDFELNNNYFIDLLVYTPGTAKVTNVPNRGTDYILNETTNLQKTSQQSFIITPTGLQRDRATLSKDSLLPQLILFRSNALDPDVVGEIFTMPKLFSFIPTQSFLNDKFFKIKLLDTNRNTIFEKTNNNDFVTFFYELTFLLFEFNQILELNFDDNSRGNIEISSFPFAGQTHKPTTNQEFYKITPTGLEAYPKP